MLPPQNAATKSGEKHGAKDRPAVAERHANRAGEIIHGCAVSRTGGGEPFCRGFPAPTNLLFGGDNKANPFGPLSARLGNRDAL